MKHILIDVSSIGYRAWYVIQKDNSVIYGVLRQLRFLQEALDITSLAFCFDSGTHKRRDIYPDYKANRTPEGKEELHRQLDELRTGILNAIGFNNIFYQNGYESDDLIGSLCHTYTKNHPNEMVIVSTDTDMWQLLSPKVSIWNPATKCMFTESIFRDNHNMDPAQWVDVKAIMGDTGDNIPGVQGVGDILAARYVRCEHVPSSKTSQRIANSTAMIELNKQLIRLPYEGTMIPVLQEEKLISRRTWVKATQKYGLQEHECPVF